LPFDSEAASAVLVAHVVKPPPKVRDVAPHVPSALAEVIDRCLAKDPAARCAPHISMATLFDVPLPDDRDSAGTVPEVISEREAQALWSRAAELQAMTGAQAHITAVPSAAISTGGDRRTLTSGYQFADVRDAAVEAGIPAGYVARAAAELGLTSAPNDDQAAPVLIDETPRASIWAGAPTSIQYEVRVPGEVPESELYVLVDTIRRRLGDPGHVGTIGRSVSWSSASKSRRLQISIVLRHGQTTIRVDERLGQLVGGLYGGIVGGGSGGSTGPIIGIGINVLHSFPKALALWATAVGGFTLLARTIFKVQVRSRRSALRKLVLELADQARDAIRVLPRA
jgi:hypothetical protein